MCRVISLATLSIYWHIRRFGCADCLLGWLHNISHDVSSGRSRYIYVRCASEPSCKTDENRNIREQIMIDMHASRIVEVSRKERSEIYYFCQLQTCCTLIWDYIFFASCTACTLDASPEWEVKLCTSDRKHLFKLRRQLSSSKKLRKKSIRFLTGTGQLSVLAA